MDILKEYDVKFSKISKMDENFIVYLPKKKLSLRHVDAKEWEILSSASIIDFALSKGYRSLISIKKTRNGKPYIKNNNGIFILSDEYGCENFRLNNKRNVMTMAGMLAHFHNCTEGFIQPQGIKVKVYWGKRAEKYRSLAIKLERFINGIKSKEKLSPFEEHAVPFLDELLKRAKECIKIFRSLDYLKALEESMKRREICINSASGSTAAVKDGKPYIIKVFDIGYNMCLEDLALLIKHSIEDLNDREIYKDILKRYSRIRNIEKGADNIIKCYVSFPYYTLKTIKKYMENPRDDDNYIKKFEKAYEIEKISNLMEV